jgi:UDP-2,3-diacylglucosamine hydrolase
MASVHYIRCMARGRILFISDLHLDASSPAVELFLGFLRTEAAHADALYILGDLFESWIGDDDDEPVRLRVRAALRALTDGGVPCFLMHGNRDFLLGESFLRATGCTLLPDPFVLRIGPRPFVLAHGDALCTEDRRYQRFRRVVRTPALQRCWLMLPLRVRRLLAGAARRRSSAYTRRMAASIMDVTPAAVATMLRGSGAEVLIHGHTHRPGIHRLDVDGQVRERIVLGDWHESGSTLEIDGAGDFIVRTFPAQETQPRAKG